MSPREYEIVQNPALGACVLWHYTKSFMDETGQRHGPSLLQTMPVLPLVFHEDTTDGLGRRRFDGGLYTALAADRTLFVGLQKRLEDMAPQTFRALHLAFGSGLLAYDRETGELHRVPRVPAPAANDEAVRLMFSTAQRLGHWFAAGSAAEMLKRLQIDL